MFSYFEDMKTENQNFFFDYDIDSDKTIKNIFWACASSRAAYADFGDCITFDTTYQTNIYHMPLAVFVGVNNHLQSTIFGCALMGDETVDSFEWVFSTFLRCMGGKQPICILTGMSIHTRCLCSNYRGVHIWKNIEKTACMYYFQKIATTSMLIF